MPYRIRLVIIFSLAWLAVWQGGYQFLAVDSYYPSGNSPERMDTSRKQSELEEKKVSLKRSASEFSTMLASAKQDVLEDYSTLKISESLSQKKFSELRDKMGDSLRATKEFNDVDAIMSQKLIETPSYFVTGPDKLLDVISDFKSSIDAAYAKELALNVDMGVNLRLQSVIRAQEELQSSKAAFKKAADWYDGIKFLPFGLLLILAIEAKKVQSRLNRLIPINMRAVLYALFLYWPIMKLCQLLIDAANL